jgi:TIR domain
MTSEIDIYVSYARRDGDAIQEFVNDVRKSLHMHVGYKVAFWIDRSNIAAGSNWQDQLQQALAGARTMLAILSPSYLQSKWARREYEAFVLSERPIFAVQLGEFRPIEEETRKLLGDRTQYVLPILSLKTRNREYHQLIERLTADIASVLVSAQTPPIHQVPEQTPQKPQPELPTRPAKGYVFLSYAEEDADFLEQLRAFFGEQGYAYWEFETSDRDYQKRIDLELEGVISNAVATVSVLSEAWKASTWSLRELFFSQEIGKPVFLLKAKSISPTLAIAGFPYIDFTTDSQQAFLRLARELKRAGL